MIPAPERRPWKLTNEAFERLLDFLNADRQRAAQEYEKVREKLTRFFEWKGCIPGAEFADETMDRVARKLEQGLETDPENPYLYFHGVASRVARERWHRAAATQSLDDMPQTRTLAVPPSPSVETSDALQTERKLGCLENCIGRLTPSSRDLLVAYHLGGAGGHIGRRKNLAEKLNIPAAALRLRVFRVRQQMERCMNRCLANVETFPGIGH